MASLPRWSSGVNNQLFELEYLLDELNGITIHPNTRKMRHLRSLEIHQITVNIRENDIQEIRPHFIEDNLKLPKQRLNKLQSKSTYNLRDHDRSSNQDQRRVSTINSTSTAGLLMGRSEIVQRQLDFQGIYVDQYCDSFYTLNHFMDMESPFYISRIFDAYSYIEDGLDIKINSNSFTINVYTKDRVNWRLLHQYHIKMSLLICLGDDIKSIHKSIKVPDLIILKLSDECYYTLTNENLPKDEIMTLQQRYSDKVRDRLRNNRVSEKTCSYDQTMKLNNYSRCIHDLLLTRNELQNRISNALKSNAQAIQTEKTIEHYHFSTEELFNQYESKKKENHSLKMKLENLCALGKKVSVSIETVEKHLVSNERDSLESQTIKFCNESENVMNNVNLEKSRIANVLLDVFPINQTVSKSGKLEFQLFDYKLPNALTMSYRVFRLMFVHGASSATNVDLIQRLTQLSSSNIEKLNALVGFISLLISSLASIMSITLRYPIRYLGSNSYIHNPISSLKLEVRAMTSEPQKNEINNQSNNNNNNNNDKGEIYPLFTNYNASLCVRFTYGLLLLKKNLTQLFEVENLAKVEDFNLLASCKVLLTCISGYEGTSVLYDEVIDDSVKGEKAVSLISTSTPKNSIFLTPPVTRIEGVRRVSGASNATKKSKSIEEYNEQVITEERINAIKDQLRLYAK